MLTTKIYLITNIMCTNNNVGLYVVLRTDSSSHFLLNFVRATIRESEGGGVVRAVLEMHSVTASDAGPYTCRASNPHGDHSQVFDVAIIGKCPHLVSTFFFH